MKLGLEEGEGRGRGGRKRERGEGRGRGGGKREEGERRGRGGGKRERGREGGRGHNTSVSPTLLTHLLGFSHKSLFSPPVLKPSQ